MVNLANRRVLLVDDRPSIHAEFHRVFRPKFAIESAFDGEEGLAKLRRARQDQTPVALVFMALSAAVNLDGTAAARQILASDPDVQVILYSGDSAYPLAEVLEALDHSDRVVLLRTPFDMVEVLSFATSLVEKWRLIREAAERSAAHAAALRQQSLALEMTLRKQNEEIIGTRDLAMFALAQLADSRDPETGEHLQRMRAYSQILAEHLADNGPYRDQIDAEFLRDFYRSTPLHDIGKVGIPDQILLKPGQLSRAEFDIMKCHASIGAEALEKTATSSEHGGFLRMAAVIARHHHERFDGKGYPDGLHGERIPLCARITALADVFDALTSSRVYKEPMDPVDARRMIERESGKHFDPAVVEAFQACFSQFLEVKARIDGQHHEALRRVLGAPLAQRNRTALQAR